MCSAIGNIIILGADYSELEELGVENIDENTFRTGCEHVENLMWTYWKLDENFGVGGDGHIGNTKIQKIQASLPQKKIQKA